MICTETRFREVLGMPEMVERIFVLGASLFLTNVGEFTVSTAFN